MQDILLRPGHIEGGYLDIVGIQVIRATFISSHWEFMIIYLYIFGKSVKQQRIVEYYAQLRAKGSRELSASNYCLRL
jgi:hypothetical protein